MKAPFFIALAATAVMLAGPASADHKFIGHGPGLFWSDCHFGWAGTCYGEDRDLLIDRLERERVTCSEAKSMLRHRGYVAVKVQSCDGPYYRFKAVLQGHHYKIKVNRRNGNLSSVKRISQ